MRSPTCAVKVLFAKGIAVGDPSGTPTDCRIDFTVNVTVNDFPQLAATRGFVHQLRKRVAKRLDVFSLPGFAGERVRVRGV